jgi:hypothetical protein
MTDRDGVLEPRGGIQRADAGPRRHVDDVDSARLSRRLLIDTIRQLEPFHESLTVVGAHAVFARVESVLPEMVMPSTKDADLAVNPAFVASEPTILSLLAEAGLEPASADRPGIYGYASESGRPQGDRTTIDLIVPAAYAGAGRRAARIPGQRNATTRAEGIELALYDRSSMMLHPLPGDPDQEPVEAMVAGHAALLVAKVYKIRDRVRDFGSRPYRLRPKDSVDVGLLMLASDPIEVAETMRRICAERPEIAGLAAETARVIESQYLHDESGVVRADLLDGVEQLVGTDVTARIDAWLAGFAGAARGW